MPLPASWDSPSVETANACNADNGNSVTKKFNAKNKDINLMVLFLKENPP